MVPFAILALHDTTSINFHCYLIDKSMRELHHGLIVLIGSIELTAGELRVMGLINTLIPKIFTYLKDSQ